ncbi:MAG: glycosyltransferase [Candidatus Buchananbacteria bacterium]|nr:glycosyltransferase [Candidatus Buchananbacteria bacterium]
MAKISIHLVTWNGQKYIEDCLNSILEQNFSDYFLLIIDNDSADQTVKIIEQQYLPLFGSKVRFVKNKNNLGFAQAHNQALLWTDSEYVLILNQDVILEPYFLANIIDFFDKHENVGSVTGKILRWQFENNEDLKKSEKSDIIDSLGLKIFKNQRVIELATGEKDLGQYEDNLKIFGVSGTCPVYRRKALEDVRYKDEYFDNDFFSYKEDIDLAYRLQWQGWQSYYLPQAMAYHDRTVKSQERKTNLDLIKQRKHKAKFINYHSYKNHWFVLLKNLSFNNFLRYSPHIIFYELKKIIYILFFETLTLKSLKEVWAKRKKIKEKRIFIMSKRIITDEKIRQWFN